MFVATLGKVLEYCALTAVSRLCVRRDLGS